MLEIIESYGLIGGFLSLVCVILFYAIKYYGGKLTDNMSSGFEKVGEKLTEQMSKQNETFTKCMVEEHDKLLNHIITDKQSHKDNHDGMLEMRIELAEEINNTLRDIMHIHHSQRAFIIELHNSFANISGVPFAKYSCTYEWFAKGLLPLTSKISGYPFSQMAKIVSDIIKSPSQQKIYTDMEKLEEENPVLFAAVKDTRTTAIVYTAMYDKNNKLMGLLVLEYQEPIKEKDINLNQLRVQAAELTSILNIRYKYIK